MKARWRHALVLFVLGLAVAACGPTRGRTPALPGSRWQAVEEMFVADAGTMTITHTLEFVSREEVRTREEGYLPAHPAMYMNADGTVDTVPARSFETSGVGTYRLSRDVLTITLEDGLRQEYRLQPDGTFTRELDYGAVLVFRRCTE